MSSPIARRIERYRLRKASTFAVSDAIRETVHLLPPKQRQRMTHVADRIRSCAITQYVAVRTPVDDATYIEVSNRRACKIRICPQCLYRAACRDRKTLERILQHLLQQHPHARVILITLTTRNRPFFSGLGDMLRDHRKGLERFWKARRIVANSLGAFTAVELEIRGSAKHPEAGVHSHSIVLVPPEYFADDVPAIWQGEYRDLWRKSARLDYDPIVDVRVVRSPDGTDDPDAIFGAIVECTKYCISLEGLFDHDETGVIRCNGLIATTILNAFHRQRLHRFDRCFADAKKRARTHV